MGRQQEGIDPEIVARPRFYSLVFQHLTPFFLGLHQLNCWGRAEETHCGLEGLWRSKGK